MTPEAARFLDKARKLLAESAVMLSVNLNEAAGRSAYLAGFHAAQALIFERTSRTAKTHNGVQSEFLRLTRDDPGIDRLSRMFLSQTYLLKAIADYETGPSSEVSRQEVAETIESGKRFVALIVGLVEKG